jgi:ribosome-associated translation inhibitor RaiA
MQVTPTVTFHGIDHSQALEAEIRARIGALESLCDSITGCDVVVGLAQRHHQRGNRFRVRINLTVPGGHLIVGHDPSLHAAAQHAEIEKVTRDNEPEPERKHAVVAVREAFDTAQRRLQDFVRAERNTGRR